MGQLRHVRVTQSEREYALYLTVLKLVGAVVKDGLVLDLQLRQSKFCIVFALLE
jgi:hypothetical protein